MQCHIIFPADRISGKFRVPITERDGIFFATRGSSIFGACLPISAEGTSEGFRPSLVCRVNTASTAIITVNNMIGVISIKRFIIYLKVILSCIGLVAFAVLFFRLGIVIRRRRSDKDISPPKTMTATPSHNQHIIGFI